MIAPGIKDRRVREAFGALAQQIADMESYHERTAGEHAPAVPTWTDEDGETVRLADMARPCLASLLALLERQGIGPYDRHGGLARAVRVELMSRGEVFEPQAPPVARRAVVRQIRE